METKKILPKLVFILVIVGFSIGVHAQQNETIKLSGVVVDSVSNLSLPNAGLILENDSDGSKQTTTTNVAGNFVFTTKPGDYTLLVKYVGYKEYHRKNIHVTTSDISINPIKLSLELNNLKTVNIQSKKPLITMTLDKVTMNISESSLSAGTTALEILRQAPGVQLAESGNVSLNSKNVTVQIDGRQSYLSGEELKNWLSSQPSNAIDKIELISNPSAKYDAASSAIINIKTTKMLNYGSNGSFTLGAGSGKFGRGNSGVNLNYRKEKINIYGSYNFMGLKQFSSLVNNRILQNNNQVTFLNEDQYSEKGMNVNTVKAGADYDINSKNSIGILLRGNFTNRNRQDESTTPIGLVNQSVDSTILTNINGNSSWVSPSANLFYKFNDLSKKQLLTVNGDFYRYGKTSNNIYTNNYFGNQNQFLHSGTQIRDNSPGYISIKSITADYEKKVKLGTLSAGLKSAFTTTNNDVTWENFDNKSWNVDQSKTNHFIYDENISAAYVGLSRQMKKIGMQLMLRGEQTNVTGNSITMNTEFNKNYFQLFPSIAFQYTKSPTNQFSLSYRKSIERPLYQYVNPFLIFQSTYNYFQGNPNLNPMTKHELQFSWSYKQTVFTSLSYNYIKDFYGTFYKQDPVTKGIVSYFDNYSNAQSLNLNIAVSKMIKKWWGFSGNFASSYFKGSYPNIVTRKSTPSLNLTATNGIILGKGWSADVMSLYSLPYSDGFYDYKSNFLLNAGITKVLNSNSSIKLTSSDVFKSYKMYYTAQYSNINLQNIARYDTRSLTLTYTQRFGNARVKKQVDRKLSIDKEEKRIGQ